MHHKASLPSIDLTKTGNQQKNPCVSHPWCKVGLSDCLSSNVNMLLVEWLAPSLFGRNLANHAVQGQPSFANASQMIFGSLFQSPCTWPMFQESNLAFKSSTRQCEWVVQATLCHPACVRRLWHKGRCDELHPIQLILGQSCPYGLELWGSSALEVPSHCVHINAIEFHFTATHNLADLRRMSFLLPLLHCHQRVRAFCRQLIRGTRCSLHDMCELHCY